MLVKELLNLTEARDEGYGVYTDIEVKKKVEKVLLSLKGAKASALTKLITEYEEVEKSLDALKEKREALNAQVKDRVATLFDAGDEVLTRMVETASITLTLSKLTKSKKETVNYKAAVDHLILLMPELKEQMDELIEEHTEVEEKETPSRLTSKLKEGIVDSAIKSFKSLLSKVKAWARGFDKKLKTLEAEVNNI